MLDQDDWKNKPLTKHINTKSLQWRYLVWTGLPGPYAVPMWMALTMLAYLYAGWLTVPLIWTGHVAYSFTWSAQTRFSYAVTWFWMIQKITGSVNKFKTFCASYRHYILLGFLFCAAAYFNETLYDTLVLWLKLVQCFVPKPWFDWIVNDLLTQVYDAIVNNILAKILCGVWAVLVYFSLTTYVNAGIVLGVLMVIRRFYDVDIGKYTPALAKTHSTWMLVALCASAIMWATGHVNQASPIQ